MREKAGGRNERQHGAWGLASERTRTAGKLGVGGEMVRSQDVCVLVGGLPCQSFCSFSVKQLVAERE